jgi:hypothetical protein
MATDFDPPRTFRFFGQLVELLARTLQVGSHSRLAGMTT